MCLHHKHHKYLTHYYVGWGWGGILVIFSQVSRVLNFSKSVSLTSDGVIFLSKDSFVCCNYITVLVMLRDNFKI